MPLNFGAEVTYRFIDPNTMAPVTGFGIDAYGEKAFHILVTRDTADCAQHKVLMFSPC